MFCFLIDKIQVSSKFTDILKITLRIHLKHMSSLLYFLYYESAFMEKNSSGILLINIIPMNITYLCEWYERKNNLKGY